jgi:hypothetical protein
METTFTFSDHAPVMFSAIVKPTGRLFSKQEYGEPVALTEKIRTAVLLSGPCAYCGDPIPTQVDHVIPLSRGGSDDRDNLAPACKTCNMEKLDFTPEEYRAWREESGLGWPPQSPFDFLKGVIADLKARFGYTDADLARGVRRMHEETLARRAAK